MVDDSDDDDDDDDDDDGRFRHGGALSQRLARPSAQALSEFSAWRLDQPSALAFSTWRLAWPSARAFTREENNPKVTLAQRQVPQRLHQTVDPDY